MDSASSLKMRRNSTSVMNSSSSRMKMGMNSASWMNNSSSWMKFVVCSASLFLDSASQVEWSQTLRVKTRVSESSRDSVSWTGQESRINKLGESGADSASRVASGRTLDLWTRRVSRVTRRVGLTWRVDLDQDIDFDQS